MGCGSSKADSTVLAIPEHQRDPDDFTIEPIELEVCNIPEFDETFFKIQENLNQLINLNNTVNDGVAEVKAAYATATGAYEVEVSVAPSTDRVLLDLFCDEPGFPRPLISEVRKLITNADVRAADIALERARGALHRYIASCETQPFTLRAEGDNGVLIMVPSTSGPPPDQPPEQLTAFNSALTKMRELVAGAYRLGIFVKPTAAFGTQMIHGRLLKHATDVLGEGHVYEPATLLDVCVSPEVSKIKEAEAYLMDRAQQLALRTRNLSDPTWEVIADHRVNLATLIPDPELRTQIRKLLLGVNISLFKLMNAGTMSRGPSRMQDAVVEVARALAKVVKDRHRYSSLPYPLKTLLKINPEVYFGDPDDPSVPAFDFSFNVDLHENSFLVPPPDCLPEDAAEVYNSIDFLKSAINDAMTQLPLISDQVDELLEKAKSFYEMAPEAAASHRMGMMEAVKSGKAVGINLKVLFDTNRLFVALGDHVKRVADDLAAGKLPAIKLIEDELGISNQM